MIDRKEQVDEDKEKKNVEKKKNRKWEEDRLIVKREWTSIMLKTGKRKREKKEWSKEERESWRV